MIIQVIMQTQTIHCISPWNDADVEFADGEVPGNEAIPAPKQWGKRIVKKQPKTLSCSRNLKQTHQKLIQLLRRRIKQRRVEKNKCEDTAGYHIRN